ncbi:Recombination protein RecR [Aquisphaera giovannonii]|uniref:Recombination protein RecR n=1 Tax=Aquisphaera giovannonii TaxID=406548 RepID=A0A5B9W4M0_9BACT|nr:recombination mediator RecR [Aquisphaera giovannonii]QEH35065.1 Recombination protein RecR [Aquisphaera giovannonii]
MARGGGGGQGGGGGGFSAAVDRLTAALGRLPGIGAKSAERLAHHLLKCPEEEAVELAEAIRAAKDQIRHCQVCFHLTEAEQPTCAICRDTRRDAGIVCVVEQSRDLLSMEKAGTYHGVYHVLLGRLAPLQGMGPDQLTVDALEHRVRSGAVREIIMATNPNLEGDGTALYIAKRLQDQPVTITRLARGVASGSTLEFASRDMLADALAGRQPF